MDWDSNKREVARKVITNLDRVAYKLELIRDNRGINYTLDQAIEDIKESLNDLEDVAKKYDYGKLPKDV